MYVKVSSLAKKGTFLYYCDTAPIPFGIWVEGVFALFDMQLAVAPRGKAAFSRPFLCVLASLHSFYTKGVARAELLSNS